MVGRCISYWNGPFLGDMFIFRGVTFSSWCFFEPIHLKKYASLSNWRKTPQFLGWKWKINWNHHLVLTCCFGLNKKNLLHGADSSSLWNHSAIGENFCPPLLGCFFGLIRQATMARWHCIIQHNPLDPCIVYYLHLFDIHVNEDKYTVYGSCGQWHAPVRGTKIFVWCLNTH